MTLLSIIVALALEQLRPLGNRNHLFLLFTRYANTLERNLNAGQNRHGVLAWLAGVLPVCLCRVRRVCAVPAGVAVSGAGLECAGALPDHGFRHFSSALTEITDALAEQRVMDARTALARWSGNPPASWKSTKSPASPSSKA